MCWTSPYPQNTRQGQTYKAKNIAQYVLDITIHKTQDEEKKQSKKHSTICVGHHHTHKTQDEDTQTKQKT